MHSANKRPQIEEDQNLWGKASANQQRRGNEELSGLVSVDFDISIGDAAESSVASLGSSEGWGHMNGVVDGNAKDPHPERAVSFRFNSDKNLAFGYGKTSDDARPSNPSSEAVPSVTGVADACNTGSGVEGANDAVAMAWSA